MHTLLSILQWIAMCFGALPILVFLVYVTFEFIIPQPEEWDLIVMRWRKWRNEGNHLWRARL